MSVFNCVRVLALGICCIGGPVMAEPDEIEPDPAPRYASVAETKLRTVLSRHLAPLLAFEIEPEQQAVMRAAQKLIAAGKLDQARQFEDKVTVPAGLALIRWLRLLRNGATAAEDYARFLKAHPGWPERDRLQRYYEIALLRDGGRAASIRDVFDDAEPVSGAGLAALASAELALGKQDAARKLAARSWCFERLPQRLEDDFLSRFGALLTEADHRCRLDRLLISSPRTRAIRRSRIQAATRLIPRLSPNERKKAEVRIKLYGGSRSGVAKDLRRIVSQPDLAKRDWGLAFQRIQSLRRARNYTEAYAHLQGVPGDDPAHVNRDEWWEERERHARHWLSKGDAARAYAVIEGVRPESPNPAKEQAFLAGWLALMRLARPHEARNHFERMVAAADGPLSKSKSEYWLARAHEKLGNRKQARAHYEASAGVRDTFHGLLSRRTAWPDRRALKLPAAAHPAAAEVERFLANPVVRALLAAYAIDLPRRDILSFYRALGNDFESAGELALLAQLASEMRDGQGEVRTGKTGVARGFDLYEFAYPVHHMPAYEPLRTPVEPALLLAVGRQESEFNTTIVSRAGARGVLQVMPITARHICRQYAIKCQLSDLLADPSYNARIASAYIADRRDEFGGSYILTLTGFNAGPGRTRQWLRSMGDPRSATVKPLDWIYRIPFEETRLYVRKVLSNVQVYRARLGEKNPLRIDRDLVRGRG